MKLTALAPAVSPVTLATRILFALKPSVLTIAVAFDRERSKVEMPNPTALILSLRRFSNCALSQL